MGGIGPEFMISRFLGRLGLFKILLKLIMEKYLTFSKGIKIYKNIKIQNENMKIN